MASSVARTNNQEDAEVAYLRTRYSTISSGVVVVLLWWTIFVCLVFTRPSPQPAPHDSLAKALLVVIAAVLVVIAIVTAQLSLGRLGFGLWDPEIPIRFRKLLLPVFAAGVIVMIAAMIYLSGGAINSSFSHFLGIISSLSIILAATWRIRGFITLVAILAYGLTCFHPLLDPRPTLGDGYIKALHITCFTTSVGLAMLAAYKREKKPASESLSDQVTEGSMTSPTINDEDLSS